MICLLLCCMCLVSSNYLIFAKYLFVPSVYHSIQEAIEAANPGDTVYVEEGNYVECLKIDKALDLVAEHGARVVLRSPSNKSPVVLVTHVNGVVRLTGNIQICGGSEGIRYIGEGTLIIHQTIISENSVGISVLGTQCEIAHAKLWGNTIAGVFFASPKGILSLFSTAIVLTPIGVVIASGGTLKMYDCLVGLVSFGLTLYSKTCGLETGLENLEKALANLTVLGEGNRVSGVEADLCPASSQKPWPAGFMSPSWSEDVREALRHLEINEAALNADDLDSAFIACTKCLSLLKESDFQLLEGWCYQRLGVVQRRLGQYGEALVSYSKAKAIYALWGMDEGVAGINVNIAVIYHILGAYDKAINLFQAARQFYIERNRPISLAKCNQNIAEVYRTLGYYSEALPFAVAAYQIYIANQMHDDVAKMEENIGLIYFGMKEYNKAISYLTKAKNFYETHKQYKNLSQVICNIGTIYMDMGKLDEAIAHYQEAINIINKKSLFALDLQWKIFKNMALAYEALGQYELAIYAYRESINAIENIRASLEIEEFKKLWSERTRQVYEGIIDLLYRLGQGASAFPYTERCRARTFLDVLYQGGVKPEQFVGLEAGLATGVVDPTAIDAAVKEALRHLQRNEAVLSFFATEQGVYLWGIAWDEETNAHTIRAPQFIPYPLAQLQNDVIRVRQALERRGPVDEELASFYTQLLFPRVLQGLPSGVDTLILIPSGPLWYLPFAALPRTDQPRVTFPRDPVSLETEKTRYRYLVEDYVLVYSSSLASLTVLLKGEAPKDGKLLGLANPARPGEQGVEAQEYPVLETAVQAFFSCYAGGEYRVYVQREAQEGRAYHEAQGARILIYACHGKFNPYVPLQSKLLLAPGGEPATEEDPRVPDGDYHAWEVLLTDHCGVDLVILAACETLLPAFCYLQETVGLLTGATPEEAPLTPEQIARITTGDEVVGLARAFLCTGANAVLATLWQAHIGPIPALFQALCRHHRAGASWAQALAQTQRAILSNPAYIHPWFWAPYQLVGRWR